MEVKTYKEDKGKRNSLFSNPFINFLRVVFNPFFCGCFRRRSVFDIHHNGLDIIVSPLETGQDAVEIGFFFFKAKLCHGFNVIGITI